MRKICLITIAALAVTACQRNDDAKQGATPEGGGLALESPKAASPKSTAGKWELQSSDEGVALALMSGPSDTVMRIFCPSGNNQLVVNVPAFKPIGSEERLSVGSGSEAHALAADPRGDRSRGGVTGTSEVPGNLAALVGGSISASYGAQKSGPHPAAEPAIVRSLVTACQDGKPARMPDKVPPVAGADACVMQDGKRLAVAPLRAIGTEPFWGAEIKGRCVTYNHPEDQQGTRIWTRFTATANGGRWSGSLGGRKFELTTRQAPGCSDGMSDNRYPIAADLTVNGEQRKGCAKPL